MKRSKPTTPANPEADAILRDVMSTPEFVEALKARAIAGKISSTEAGLLRSLGVSVPEMDRDGAAREAMREMDVETSCLLSDLCRMSMRSPDSTRLRIIRAGAIVAVGYDASDPSPRPGIRTMADRLRPRTPEPSLRMEDSPDDADLMP